MFIFNLFHQSVRSTNFPCVIVLGTLNFQHPNASLPAIRRAFLSGLPRSRHMEDTLLFHLLLALRDGPIRTCPNGSLLRGHWRKVMENLTNKKCLSNELTLKLTQPPSKRFCNQRNWFTGVLSSIFTCPTSATCLHAPEAVDVCSRAFWTAWRGRWNCDLDGYSHKVWAYICSAIVLPRSQIKYSVLFVTVPRQAN